MDDLTPETLAGWKRDAETPVPDPNSQQHVRDCAGWEDCHCFVKFQYGWQERRGDLHAGRVVALLDALAAEKAARPMPWTLCTGADDCPEQWHEHGCYADHGRCSEPTEHHGWADYEREKAAREEAERRVQVQARATSSACFHASEYAKRAEAAEARVAELEQENVRVTDLHRNQMHKAADAEAAYAALVARCEALADEWEALSGRYETYGRGTSRSPYGRRNAVGDQVLRQIAHTHRENAAALRALTEKEQDQ